MKKKLTTIEILICPEKWITKQNKVYLKLDNKGYFYIQTHANENEFYFAMVDSYFKLFYPTIAVDIIRSDHLS